MRKTVIYNTDQFTLTSWGNGTAYGFARKAGDGQPAESIWLRGDDAMQFRAELDDLEDAWSDASANCVLSRLWWSYDTLAEPVPVRHIHPFDPMAPLASHPVL